MGMFRHSGFVVVSNGSTNIHSFREQLYDGRVTISDTDDKGDRYKTLFIVRDGRISMQRMMKNGRTFYFIEYGKVERKKGQFTLRFRKGTNMGMDGLSVRHDQLVFGLPGKCKTFYRKGRLIWQRFTHLNGRLCYHFKVGAEMLFLKYPDGKPMFEFKGKINSSDKPGGYLVWHDQWRDQQQGWDWSKNGNCEFTLWESDGRVLDKGQFVNRQRVGEWIIKGRRMFYFNGLAVPYRLFHTPPEKLDARKILNMTNTDARSIMMGRIGMKRIVEECSGKEIHRSNGMVIYHFPVKNRRDPVSILQVTCPSTKQPYFLRVPPEFSDCEEARQWTFGVNPNVNRIDFDIET